MYWCKASLDAFQRARSYGQEGWCHQYVRRYGDGHGRRLGEGVKHDIHISKHQGHWGVEEEGRGVNSIQYGVSGGSDGKFNHCRNTVDIQSMPPGKSYIH